MKKAAVQFDPALLKVIAHGSTTVEQSLLTIERNANELHRVYYLLTARLPHQETKKILGATAVEELQAGISTFQILTGKRLADQYVSVVESLNNRRLYTAALATRAIIEVTASVVYFETTVIPLLEKGIRSQQELDQVATLMDKQVRAGRFDWKRWLSGGKDREELLKAYAGAEEEPRPEHFQTNILTMIKKLDNRFSQKDESRKGQIRLVYAILSDICHPAVGAHMLILANRPAKGWYLVESEPTDEMIRWYCLHTTVPVLERIYDVLRDSFRRLRYAAETLQSA